MEQLNRVELVGIVDSVRVQDYDGTKLARIGLATNYAYKDREGTCVIETAWHNIIAWEGRNIPNLLAIRKGSKLHLFGRIRYQRYTGVDGAEHYGVDILANKMEIVGDDKTVLKMETSQSEKESSTPETLAEQSANLRRAAIKKIEDFMNGHHIERIYASDIEEGSSPIVFEDKNDGNLTYTLNQIMLLADGLNIQASNCCDTVVWKATYIDTDTLIGIADWLFKNKDKFNI